FHELRHSCASLLINQGIGLKEVQDWMGHSDISTTANIYGHLETQRKVAMANALSECLGNSR
ncbi:MAG: tyrosine-type recombinase/integrase, partial [Oscillospiraceae bacterium]|nr:tyrosine-type recombinase/integrase [Oscillospiraceae bacterium]